MTAFCERQCYLGPARYPQAPATDCSVSLEHIPSCRAHKSGRGWRQRCGVANAVCALASRRTCPQQWPPRVDLTQTRNMSWPSLFLATRLPVLPLRTLTVTYSDSDGSTFFAQVGLSYQEISIRAVLWRRAFHVNTQHDGVRSKDQNLRLSHTQKTAKEGS
jgi:hypothetical protein